MAEIPIPKKYESVSEMNPIDSTVVNYGLYKIQKYDKLSLSIWDHPDLSVGSVFNTKATMNTVDRFIVVNEEGEASFPKIGTLKAEGKTVNDLQEILIKQYETWIKDPQIVLRVENKQITVLGAVKTPGNYSLYKNAFTLSELLGMVGGTVQYANTKECQIVRDGVAYSFDLSTLNTSLFHELELYAGDVLHIPFNKNQRMSERSTGIIATTGVLSTVAILISVLSK